MRVSTVYAASFDAPAGFQKHSFKDIGDTWGSWKTWRSCETANVVCHDLVRARELYQKALHAVTNLYVPEKFYQSMARPTGVKLYQGEFQSQTVDIEDIVAMHLAMGQSDLVLLMGFQLQNPGVITDPAQATRLRHRLGMIRSCVVKNANVQWVAVDHAVDFDTAFENISNLTRDTTQNVLNLLS